MQGSVVPCRNRPAWTTGPETPWGQGLGFLFISVAQVSIYQHQTWHHYWSNNLSIVSGRSLVLHCIAIKQGIGMSTSAQNPKGPRGTVGCSLGHSDPFPFCCTLHPSPHFLRCYSNPLWPGEEGRQVQWSVHQAETGERCRRKVCAAYSQHDPDPNCSAAQG